MAGCKRELSLAVGALFMKLLISRLFGFRLSLITEAVHQMNYNFVLQLKISWLRMSINC